MTEKRILKGSCSICKGAIRLPCVLMYRNEPVCGSCFRKVLKQTLGGKKNGV